MKNIKKQIKRELNQKLVTAAMMHVGGLKKQKQKKFVQYLEGKMENVANYYISLLKKKTAKDMLFAVPENEMEIIKSPEDDKMGIEINAEIVN